MKKTLLLSIGFLMGLWTFCQAQEQMTTSAALASGAYSGSDRYNSAPQTWSTMGAGSVAPNLYTGTVSADIPVYTYQDDDFTVPISVNYASNGYTPNAQANFVGLGWALNAGGEIVQTVRGIPDMDLVGSYQGYSKLTSDMLNRAAVLNSAYIRKAYHIYATDQNGRYMETEPDIFSFNFMGHRGKFMFAGNKAYVFDSNHPYGEYTIKYEEIFPTPPATAMRHVITITAGDGYRYKFELMDKGEFDVESMKEDWESLLFKSNNPTRTWYLTQAIAPNGRTVSFEYISSGLSNYVPGGITKWDSSEQSSIKDMDFVASTQATRQLKKIDIDKGLIIDFRYGTRNPEKTSTGASVSVQQKLDTIRISKQGGTVLKECSFQYTYGSNAGNPVLLLSAVKVQGDGTYRMEYNQTAPKAGFPFQKSPSFDHWGYYNAGPAQNDESISIPVHSESENFAEEEIARVKTNRTPNTQYAMLGMLTKLTYPQGGYTTFEYESHEYNKILTRTRLSNNMPKLEETSTLQFAGGVRIKKITNYPIDGKESSKTYIYTRTGKTPGKSSGNLLVKPFYFFYMKEYDKNNPSVFKRSFTAYFTRCIASFRSTPNHVEYEKVTEKYDDGSYTVYDFANYSNFPDKYRSRKDSLPSSEITIKNAPLVNNFVLEPDYEPQFRGTLLAVSYYNSGDTIQRKQTYQYNTSKSRRYVESVKYAADYFYVQRSYLESYPVVGITTEDCFDNGLNNVKRSAESYMYNALGQVSCVSRWESGGTTTSDYVTYVSDLTAAQKIEIAGQSTVYDKMLTRNVLNLPIYTKKIRTVSLPGKSGTFDQQVSATRNQYCVVSDSIIRAKLYEVGDIASPLSGTAKPTYYTTLTFDKYDSKGRPLQTTDRSGVITCYVWGYNGLHLVAKIVGVNYSVVQPIVGQTTPLSGALTTTQETNLRNLSAFVTSYTYDPYIGITGIKDPSGRSVYYQYHNTSYDPYSKGKLSGVYDDERRAIYTYGYAVAYE